MKYFILILESGVLLSGNESKLFFPINKKKLNMTVILISTIAVILDKSFSTEDE